MSSASDWYRLTEDDSTVDTTVIEITVDPYKDVLYYYQKVSMSEADSSAKLSFTYDIVNCPDDVDIHNNVEEFETLLGDILVSIICEKENELRDNDINTPD